MIVVGISVGYAVGFAFGYSAARSTGQLRRPDGQLAAGALCASEGARGAQESAFKRSDHWGIDSNGHYHYYTD